MAILLGSFDFDFPQNAVLTQYVRLFKGVANFTQGTEIDRINDKDQLHLIIEGLCQYEDGEFTPAERRFELLKLIIDKDETYLTKIMELMPILEKDQFQNYLMRHGFLVLRSKIVHRKYETRSR